MKEPTGFKKAALYTGAIIRNRDEDGVRKHARSSALHAAATVGLIAAAPFTMGLTGLAALYTGYRTYSEASKAAQDQSVVADVAAARREQEMRSIISASGDAPGLGDKIGGLFSRSAEKKKEVTAADVHPFFAKNKNTPKK